MSVESERLKWMEEILAERFGQSWQLVANDRKLVMKQTGRQGQLVFDFLESAFVQTGMPYGLACEWWDVEHPWFSVLEEPSLPAPSSKPLKLPLIELAQGMAVCHYDILGLAFWSMNRLEEINRKDLDDHRRFPAISSHAFKNDYLERPLVDEWLDILGQVIKKVWPTLELHQHKFKVKVSHDVDGPARYAFQGFKGLLRTMGGDVLVRREFSAALKAPWIWLNSRETIHPCDPANTFDWLMKQSEENGLKSAFYFICGRTAPDKDALYELEMPQIRKLMREIHQRGHEIGLHPSYNTYQRPKEIANEAERLRKICSEEGIDQKEWGGRMHYLRWDPAVTLQAWNDAGMSYDSTLGYADRPGFRCGTCFEFPAFDIVNGKVLSLRIRPLIAMDCTVIADRYMGLGSTELAYEKFSGLRLKCKKVRGVFTLLWHNSFFSSPKDFDIYSRLISETSQRVSIS